MTMKKIVGIRHEDKYEMERRVAIVPQHVSKLIDNELGFHVQHSQKRIFHDEAFEQAGATIVKSLDQASVVFGVKEMPISFFEPQKTYVFFSHVIKGQSYNMPMLKAMMEKKCQLIDYEKIENSEGKRLIFFGRFAGLAGMINSLWSLGQRLLLKGIETPLAEIRQAHTYQSLQEASEAVSKAGQLIAKNGLPAEVAPVVIGFTGYGNVSKGAQEIANLLPSIEVTPEQLLHLDQKKAPRNLVYKVIFKEADISASIEPSSHFDLSHYYAHPEAYRNNFERFIPHLTILMNCMYWDKRYPRIVTKDFLAELFKNKSPKLEVIGDVTCDPDGSIECTHKGTEIEDPVFVYNPLKRTFEMGFEGDGVLVMAVDILPSELPHESSMAFSDALLRYVKAIATADYHVPFEELHLPDAIKNALILYQGKLTPNYEYLQKYL